MSLTYNVQVCTAPDGGDVKLTSEHVLFDCDAVDSARRRLGIAEFHRNFDKNGCKSVTSFAAYVSGLSVDGVKISVAEYLGRGRVIKELQHIWLSVWGAE